MTCFCWRRWAVLACVFPAMLLAAGCGPADTEPADGPEDTPAGEQAPAATEESLDPGADGAAGDDTADAASAGEPVDGDWIIARMPAEPATLNPLTSSDYYATVINDLVFETLLEIDNETIELKPLLAASMPEVSEDHLAYTFTLRDDIHFSDGEPITAEDVKFTFDTAMDPATDAPHLRNYLESIETVEVIDERTVRFTCNRPYFRNPVVIGTIAILPEHIYGEGDFNTHANNRSPAGSGPYVFENWTTGQEISLTRNEDYWGQKPHILRMVYRLITEDTAALQVLRRGEMDTMGLTPEQWVNQTSGAAFSDRFEKRDYYRPNYSYIGWNMRRPLFEDKRVRRALTMLLDRELILEEIYYGLGELTTGPFFLSEPENNDAIEPWPYDPEAARALLEEAGWTDSDNDGVRDKDGRSFAFELLITNNSPEAEQIATIFQEELERAGVTMSIRQLEWATFLQSVKTHEFDASMLGWALTPYPDPYQLWHSSQTVVNGSNHCGFENAEADRIIEEARQVFDREERVEMYHRFHEIIHDQQPYTFLFYRKSLAAIDRRYENVNVYPYAGLYQREWWVPQAEQRYP